MTDDAQTSPAGRPDPTVRRLRPLGETIFASMSRLAKEADAINLGQGYPDADGPEAMLDEAIAAIRRGDNQYAPGRGVEELRRAICDDRRRRLGQNWDPDRECLVTVGATEGIAAAVLGLVEPGAHVVLVEPFYDAYRAAVALADARWDSVPLVSGDDGWCLDVDALEATVRDDTAMIIINTPHNPTGAILTDAELESIAAAARRAGAIVVADEVYERLLYDGHAHASIADLPEMRDRCVIVSSAAKSLNVTGWKTGWVLAAPDLIDAVTTAKQFLSYVGVTHVQSAVAVGLDECGDWVDDMAAELKENKDVLVRGLRELGLEVHDAEGGYFIVADVSPLGLGDGMQTCLALPEKVGVAGIPVAAFVADGDDEKWRNLVRFGFCKKRAVIEEALARLGRHMAAQTN
ncbi:aminotransferase class I/II-fold pyridoxal phosphate-dependent enzyme [uncultured Corynebacterium sp.]|uniref:aminotransferase class I/II-fold pyridoxal phosphate-dependent enzyme n=1 Tax=uncultured Corynebacterium sp. TaxID=159447 RepID=UPI0025D3BDAE|nr:aminotransferase class I/II-fold pyridoxal phosphate-dependent enzyme [uncultured Corynebacterium sp.]